MEKSQVDSFYGRVPWNDAFHYAVYQSDRRRDDLKRSGTISNRNSTMLNKESVLFSSFVERIHLLQGNVSRSFQAIVYSVNPESGLGNVIIGMVSCVIAAVATDRAIQSTPVHRVPPFSDALSPLFRLLLPCVPFDAVRQDADSSLVSGTLLYAQRVSTRSRH